jgi:hypothetical protein
MLDTRYWILDAGCWILDAGFSMLDVRYWIPELTGIRCTAQDARLLVVFSSCGMLDADCSIFVVG